MANFKLGALRFIGNRRKKKLNRKPFYLALNFADHFSFSTRTFELKVHATSDIGSHPVRCYNGIKYQNNDVHNDDDCDTKNVYVAM